MKKQFLSMIGIASLILGNAQQTIAGPAISKMLCEIDGTTAMLLPVTGVVIALDVARTNRRITQADKLNQIEQDRIIQQELLEKLALSEEVALLDHKLGRVSVIAAKSNNNSRWSLVIFAANAIDNTNNPGIPLNLSEFRNNIPDDIILGRYSIDHIQIEADQPSEHQAMLTGYMHTILRHEIEHLSEKYLTIFFKTTWKSSRIAQAKAKAVSGLQRTLQYLQTETANAGIASRSFDDHLRLARANSALYEGKRKLTQELKDILNI